MHGDGIRTGTTTSKLTTAPLPKPDMWAAYRMRWRRRGLLWRSFRSRHQLSCRVDRTGQIAPGGVVVVMTLHNERTRLPFTLAHYRRLGVGHFLIVDNDSSDGSGDYLAEQPDVSLWQTAHSYRSARFGLDWMTWLQMRYADDRWCLMVDVDELLIYAHHDSRNLGALTAWLDAQGRRVFGAHMLDLYPKGALSEATYTPGQDPLEVLQWFDAGPYRAKRQMPLGNLWVQGGMRERVFFQGHPKRSPTLNKIPLVRWSWRYAYVNSCHSALPAALNHGYDGPGGEAPSGVLLHTKFLPEIVAKSEIEKQRQQHFHRPEKFADYYDAIAEAPDLWSPDSQKFTGWQQLEALGLMRAGDW
ncbi:glycosyltransferase family 2 protein [Shimia sp. MMG029]|uniref:glycosyltransferase family 2 protein n=1 Tax=Shimia sp. MMG029 TaxID=3021978 RepID=UPI003F93BB34